VREGRAIFGRCLPSTPDVIVMTSVVALYDALTGAPARVIAEAFERLKDRLPLIFGQVAAIAALVKRL